MNKTLTIAFTQMWESFSFFGMRALLVLYLISGAGYSASDAVIMYTLYIASVKVFAGLGGYIADRFLGYKHAVILGGGLIMLGHLVLTFTTLFYLSLGCIIVGSALFRVNLQALLGKSYQGNDQERDPGFTLFYVGMNIGGLSAAILCGLVAQMYGWHAGFGLAAFGMMIGLIFFLSKQHMFESERKRPAVVTFPVGLLAAGAVALIMSYFSIVEAFALPLGILFLFYLLFKMGKKVILGVGMSILFLILFSTAEELWGSLLMLFSEGHIDRFILGFEIPSPAIAAMNPLTIILLGPLLARMNLRYEVKIAAGFLAVAIAFLLLYITSIMVHPSLFYLVTSLMFIAIGELFLVPSILSFASKIAPENQSGMMMGATIIALSIGSLLSGKIALFSYGPVFIGVAVVALGLFTALALRLRSPSTGLVEH